LYSRWDLGGPKDPALAIVAAEVGGNAQKLVVVGVLVALVVDCFAKNLEVRNCTKETDKILGCYI
jgi:hypothetical protein